MSKNNPDLPQGTHWELRSAVVRGFVSEALVRQMVELGCGLTVQKKLLSLGVPEMERWVKNRLAASDFLKQRQVIDETFTKLLDDLDTFKPLLNKPKASDKMRSLIRQAQVELWAKE